MSKRSILKEVTAGLNLATKRSFSVTSCQAQQKSSLAEAIQQQRLDKNRNLLPPLRYEIVKPDKLDLAIELLYASYHPYEPLTKHLGLMKGVGSIPDMDRLVENTLHENLSLFAIDENDKVLAVCINGVSSKNDWHMGVDEIANKFTDPNVRPLVAIRQMTHNKGVKIFEEVGTDVLFGIKMVGIHPSLQGKGMSTDIIRRSILLAGCLGFTGLKAEASTSNAQAAFLTIGFTPVAEILYKDFEYQGQKVFAGVEDEKGLVLFQKKFFQSCLKHIV
eukprot:TRINITY_DN13566_c0_g1_i5.p1 TRINITY_DN13566_c0_g1~~TRINITY_DN13566_c0_g1_i5.p1  ORF type:complete len:301 (+),score=73.09 TRINITY_DN13566_c0_g1_i5:78-905(+)